MGRSGRSRGLGAVALVSALALILGACGSSGSSKGSGKKSSGGGSNTAPKADTSPGTFHGSLVYGLEADTSVLERELVELARRTVREHPEVGALVLECTNFVPYSQAMRRAAGVPIFDLYTLVMWATLGLEGRDF